MGHRPVGRDTRGLRAEIANVMSGREEDKEHLKKKVKEKLLAAGALSVGIAEAKPVDKKACMEYAHWLERGRNAGMTFMGNHRDIREDPRLLLEGAKSIICMAFGYAAKERRGTGLPRISAYALLPDYHEWIKKRIREAGLNEILGEEHKDWRICVDSAPIMERYWAVKSGIAIRGDNGAAIIPGSGSEVFLAEIITTREVAADKETEDNCGHCGACMRACPTGALRNDGTIDCDRCISYLTIEHRGEWIKPEHIEAMSTKEGKETLFGCDRCISACLHNRKGANEGHTPAPIETIVTLTPQKILEAPAEELSSILKGSCLKRAKNAGIIRNASNLTTV